MLGFVIKVEIRKVLGKFAVKFKSGILNIWALEYRTLLETNNIRGKL